MSRPRFWVATGAFYGRSRGWARHRFEVATWLVEIGVATPFFEVATWAVLVGQKGGRDMGLTSRPGLVV